MSDSSNLSNSNNISGSELIALGSALAIAIGNSIDNTEELNLLAAFFTALGDNLALIAVTRDDS